MPTFSGARAISVHRVNTHLPLDSTLQTTTLASHPTHSNKSTYPSFSFVLSRASHASATPNLICLLLIIYLSPPLPPLPRSFLHTRLCVHAGTYRSCSLRRLDDTRSYTVFFSPSLDQRASSSHKASIDYHKHAISPLHAPRLDSISAGAMALWKFRTTLYQGPSISMMYIIFTHAL